MRSAKEMTKLSEVYETSMYNERLLIQTELLMLKSVVECENRFTELTEWNAYLVNKLSDAGYRIEGDISNPTGHGFIWVWWDYNKYRNCKK